MDAKSTKYEKRRCCLDKEKKKFDISYPGAGSWPWHGLVMALAHGLAMMACTGWAWSGLGAGWSWPWHGLAMVSLAQEWL